MKGWLYLFQVVAALLNAYERGMDTQRKINNDRVKNEKIELEKQITVARIAHENNRANVLDEIEIEMRLLEIEQKKLELIKRRRDLQLDVPEFTPSDYDAPS